MNMNKISPDFIFCVPLKLSFLIAFLKGPKSDLNAWLRWWHSGIENKCVCLCVCVTACEYMWGILHVRKYIFSFLKSTSGHFLGSSEEFSHQSFKNLDRSFSKYCHWDIFYPNLPVSRVTVQHCDDVSIYNLLKYLVSGEILNGNPSLYLSFTCLLCLILFQSLTLSLSVSFSTSLFKTTSSLFHKVQVECNVWMGFKLKPFGLTPTVSLSLQCNSYIINHIRCLKTWSKQIIYSG